jgi:ATP-dependent DNA ligase
MLATLGRPPAYFSDFAVEAKYDGQRALATPARRRADWRSDIFAHQ